MKRFVDYVALMHWGEEVSNLRGHWFFINKKDFNDRFLPPSDMIGSDVWGGDT
jgi:hypothetical protein